MGCAKTEGATSLLRGCIKKGRKSERGEGKGGRDPEGRKGDLPTSRHKTKLKAAQPRSERATGQLGADTQGGGCLPRVASANSLRKTKSFCVEETPKAETETFQQHGLGAKSLFLLRVPAARRLLF